MKALIVLILFPCLLFAQLTPKHLSNRHNFNSVSSNINSKFNETFTDKALSDFQKTDKELEINETSSAPQNSISKMRYEKKIYVDSSKIIYSWGEGPPYVMRYCMGINNFKKEHYSMGSGEILKILEKDIKERNMPNKFYSTAKLHHRIETTLLITSLTSIVGGLIMGNVGYKAGFYFTLGGAITLPLNSFVYSLIWQWMYLDDAINEYNKNLAF